MHNLPLRGQVALVTGAGRRIGRTIALTLARAGADVAVNYNQSRSEAHEAVRQIAALGVAAIAIHADISKPAQVRAMFRTLERRYENRWPVVNRLRLTALPPRPRKHKGQRFQV